MGISLCAVVEVWQEAVPEHSVRGCWCELAMWEFGKNYALGAALFAAPGGHRHWPRDVCAFAADLQEHGIADQDLQWFEPAGLPAVTPALGARFEALAIGLLAFKCPVRVLFYRI